MFHVPYTCLHILHIRYWLLCRRCPPPPFPFHHVCYMAGGSATCHSLSVNGATLPLALFQRDGYRSSARCLPPVAFGVLVCRCQQRSPESPLLWLLRAPPPLPASLPCPSVAPPATPPRLPTSVPRQSAARQVPPAHSRRHIYHARHMSGGHVCQSWSSPAIASTAWFTCCLHIRWSHCSTYAERWRSP